MHTLKTVVWMREKRKSFGFFSFLFTLLSKVVKIIGFLCTKETLKLYCYVTMELAACSVDL